MKKVLIVDDEDDIREVAQLSLEMMAGWTVVGAASGAEALAEAIREKPDVILLDVMMPGMDGLSTFLRLREQAETKDIPVILLTAKIQDAEGMRRYTQLGVAGVIAKPFDPITLADQVRKTINAT